MIKAITRCTLLALALFSPAAAAAPIKLKLAFNTSDRSDLYLGAVKSFVDAVNKEANGLIEIDVYFSGALTGKSPNPQLVLDGVADLAVILPGPWQLRFPDDGAVELPGLFQDAREATLVYSGLIGADALRGYEELFVIGAFSFGPGSIHSRKRLTSLSDLQGIAQSIIRKHSGEPMASRFVDYWQELESSELERIKSNVRRTVTVSSRSDAEAAQAVFNSFYDEWAAASPRYLALLALVEKELAKLRSTP